MRGYWAAGLLLVACSGGAARNAQQESAAQTAQPGAVTSVRADSFIQAITLTWSPPASGVVTGYFVQELGGGRQEVPVDRRLASFGGLIGGSKHCFEVYALNGSIRGPASPLTCAKAYATEISPPINVRATPIPRGARVTWDPPVDNEGEPITGWQIDSVPSMVRTDASSNANSADVIGLEDGKTYTFRVSAQADAPEPARSIDVESNPVTVSTIWPDGTWHQAASLPDASTRAAFVMGGRLYAVGTTKVYVAPLDADGRPTTWTAVGSTSGIGFFDTSTYVAVPSGDGGGYLYITGGGANMEGDKGTVWFARIGADGTVGPFVTTSSISPGPAYHAAFADGGHLYVAGGSWWSGGSFTGYGTDLPFVQVADISSDGTLSPWRKVALLPRPSQQLSAAVWNHRLYVVASHGGGVDVTFAALLPDGSLGPWKRATAQPAEVIERPVLESAGGRLYLLGGFSPNNSVRVGQLGPDGDVIAWEQSAADAFNGPRIEPSIALTETRAYLMGGANSPFYDVQWAKIDPATGHFAPLTPLARPHPPDPPVHVRAVGGNTTATVRWDPPADDGGLPITGYSVTAFEASLAVAHADVDATTTTATLTGLPNNHAYTFDVAARNSAGAGSGSGPTDDVVPAASPKWRPAPHVFLDGGYQQDPFLAGDVLLISGMRQAALPLDPGGIPWGQIGPGWFDGFSGSSHSWATATRQLDATTTCAYGVGGAEGFQSTGGVSIGCIRGDGFYGAYLPAPPRSPRGLQPTRMNGAAAILGQFLYALGGTNQDVFDGPKTDLADVSFAPLAPDGSVGAWQHTSPLPAPIALPISVVRGGDLYVLVEQGLLRATPAADGTIAGWQSAGAPMPAAPGARMALANDLLYVVSPQGVLRGRFGAGGDISSWESDSADAPDLRLVRGLAARTDRLYLWGDTGLFVGRIDPATGHLLAW